MKKVIRIKLRNRLLYTACFLLATLAGMAQTIGIRPELVTACNDPKAKIEVEIGTNNVYTVLVSNLTDGKEVSEVKWKQGESCPWTTLYTPPYAFTPTGTETLYVEVKVTGGTFRLHVTGVGVSVAVNGNLQTANETFQAGTPVTVEATPNTTTDGTTIRILSLTGYSADGTFLFTPVAGGAANKQATFTMPASDVYIQVNTQTSIPAGKEEPKVEDKVQTPVITVPDGAIQNPPAQSELKLIVEEVVTKDSARVTETLAQLKQDSSKLGNILLPVEIRLEQTTTSGGQQETTPVENLHKPVTITLPYPSGAGQTDQIRILHLREQSGLMTADTLTPRQTANWLSFEVDGFSPFIIGVTKAIGDTPDRVTVSPRTLSLKIGATTTGQLAATVSKSEAPLATNNTVTWKSTDTGIATVDATGRVTALKAGTAAIVVRTDFGGFTDTCRVTVSPADTPIPDPIPEPEPEDPTANAEVAPNAPQAYALQGAAVLLSPRPLAIHIYNVAGIRVKQLPATEGTRRVALPKGIYIIRFADGTTFKLNIR